MNKKGELEIIILVFCLFISLVAVIYFVGGANKQNKEAEELCHSKGLEFSQLQTYVPATLSIKCYNNCFNNTHGDYECNVSYFKIED